MKAEFFCVAVLLLMSGVFVAYSRHDGRHYLQHSGVYIKESSMTVSNGSDYEQVKYAGRIRFSVDGRAIDSISPGGYLSYRKNDLKWVAEGDTAGVIRYTFYDDGEKKELDEKGRKFLAETISIIIGYHCVPRESEPQVRCP